MRKRYAIFVLAVLLLLSACATKHPVSKYCAENEIFTYQKIDPTKTQIVVSRTGNIPVKEFCEAFEERNPDVQVIYLDITGGNNSYMPLIDWITKGDAPDVVFSSTVFFNEELTMQYFEKLSDYPFIQNYEAAALKRTATENEIYWLPGPSSINAMLYNKTLFEQYGWTIPTTFDEFVRLCDTIQQDTDGEIEAWNPNAKYDAELLKALEAFTYEELFGGADNRAWYNSFVADNATFIPHMEPYIQVIETLIQHNILKAEHFSYSATLRGKEFTDGKIAMINMNIYDADTTAYDFGYFPFPTTKGDLGYLCDNYSSFVGLAKKEHTDKEQDAINRFLSFFSSIEGQKIYIGNSMQVSNVKGVPLNQSDDLAALQPAVSAGHLFAMMNFESTVGKKRNISLHQIAIDMVLGVKSKEEYLATATSTPYETISEQGADQSEIVAHVQKDFTMLETSFYFADAYRQLTEADIGLVAHGIAYRGNLVRLFAGDITEDMVSVLKPRSFTNDAKLLKVSMSGKQLLAAMNHPLGNDSIADCIYAYSGLVCEVAPWNTLGEKYQSVRLENGDEIQSDQLYTVAIWEGSIREEYITEVVESYEGSWEELMMKEMKAAGILQPTEEERITLIWE